MRWATLALFEITSYVSFIDFLVWEYIHSLPNEKLANRYVYIILCVFNTREYVRKDNCLLVYVVYTKSSGNFFAGYETEFQEKNPKF